jgi:hypothetical protein
MDHGRRLKDGAKGVTGEMSGCFMAHSKNCPIRRSDEQKLI